MRFNGTQMLMTRGDSESIVVRAKDRGWQEGEVIEFTVRKQPHYGKSIYKKVFRFVNGDAIIEINPEDTEGLDFGTYYYDIQLTFPGNVIKTLVRDSEFVIGREETYGN